MHKQVKQSLRQYRLVVALAFVLSLGFVGTAGADSSSSAHYMVNETQFGIGSSLHDCSDNYCAKTSVGDTTVGSASSDNYSAQFGFNTSNDPMLEVIVVPGPQDMGVLDETKTGTATSLIKVRNYLSNGYVLQITGAAPNQGIHTLKTMEPKSDGSGCPCTSQPGTEQFGINLADNSTPDVGADPVQVPSGSFSFGHVISDEDTASANNPNDDGAYFSVANFFSYKDGDIVALSNKSTGETDYTMSMIINVSNVTPGGRYNGTFSAVVTGLF